MSKDEIKMEKNRISAKISREKKKKQLEELEVLTETLKKENQRLHEDNRKNKRIICDFQYFFSKNICPDCSKNLPNEIKKYIGSMSTGKSNVDELMIVSSSRGEGSIGNFAKLSLLTGILLIVCFVGNMAKEYNSTSAPKPKGRNLSAISPFTAYSDIEYDANIKNSERIRQINKAVSSQIEHIDKPKVLFETKKDTTNIVKPEFEKHKHFLE